MKTIIHNNKCQGQWWPLWRYSYVLERNQIWKCWAKPFCIGAKRFLLSGKMCEYWKISVRNVLYFSESEKIFEAKGRDTLIIWIFSLNKVKNFMDFCLYSYVPVFRSILRLCGTLYSIYVLCKLLKIININPLVLDC